jgi:TolB-like protein
MKTDQQNRSFLRELKRRRVLHTASLYVVGAWIALQVVEVLSGAGLPPSTMRNLLVLLSIGFPIALVIGWFFDISKEGIVKTPPLAEGEQLPALKFIDHVLLLGLLLVVVIDGYILSFQPPSDIQFESSSTSQQRKIAVLGFEDAGLAEDADPIGDVFAGELRGSLTRVAGLQVLGPETSKMLQMAGNNRLATAGELLVTAIVLGEVLLEGGHIKVNATLIGVPNGENIWSSRVEAPVGDSIRLQQDLLKQLVGAIAPNLDPDPVHGPRAGIGECSAVYDIYLRGKQLSKARKITQNEQYKKGMELLREAVTIDDQCALAWEAIAVGLVNYTMPGFVKAGVAARRALEINDSLPEAWTVLAEIAEDEERWIDSEELYLRALRVDPTNVQANRIYGETLVARGRASAGLRHILDAYHYDPVSVNVNFTAAMAAWYASDSELIFKHARIAMELANLRNAWALDSIAEAHLLRGETEQALEIYAEGANHPPWFPDCVRARDDPALVPAVREAAREMLEMIVTGQEDARWGNAWRLMRCGVWIGDPDLTFGILLSKAYQSIFGEGMPTKIMFINMFQPDAAILRQDPRFREMVVESGLLDYWRKWGWADYCEADGDSFRCD